jgi:hypothetical protein
MCRHGGSMKIGRNAPCHCGSGKKYKQCCLRKDEEAKRAALATPISPRRRATAAGTGPRRGQTRALPRNARWRRWKRAITPTRWRSSAHDPEPELDDEMAFAMLNTLFRHHRNCDRERNRALMHRLRGRRPGSTPRRHIVRRLTNALVAKRGDACRRWPGDGGASGGLTVVSCRNPVGLSRPVIRARRGHPPCLATVRRSSIVSGAWTVPNAP